MSKLDQLIEMLEPKEIEEGGRTETDMLQSYASAGDAVQTLKKALADIHEVGDGSTVNGQLVTRLKKFTGKVSQYADSVRSLALNMKRSMLYPAPKLRSKNFYEDVDLDEGRYASPRVTSLGLDTDQEEMFSQVLMTAENEGRFYAKKDAKGAVDFAIKDYISRKLDDMKHDGQKIRSHAIKELVASWRRK
jgi:hypothetical protein